MPDNTVLQRVCGTNDSNLRLIESALGVSVFACGNELSIDSDSQNAERRFRFIIDRMLDEISDDGDGASDSDLIRSIISTDAGGRGGASSRERELFEQCSITVPGGIRKVYPRTAGQARFVRLLRGHDLVFATGPAGSGKTFLAVAEALRLVLSHQKNTLILTRPVVEAGESLGYLPGDLQDKISPYIRPLYDAMSAVIPRETVRRMTEAGIIETAPLAYMRGRTLNDSVVILDEAQNTTREQMKMFLTRLGDNSKVFVTGDITQIDLPHKVPSGLLHALGILEDVPGVGIQRLTPDDVVRNALVKQIIRAYDYEQE